MNDGDKPRFFRALNSLGAVFRVDVDALLLEGYWLGLRDLPLPDVERAVAAAIAQGKFFPRPVELRELAGVMDPQRRATLAWGDVIVAIGSVGAYRAVDFADKRINAAIRMMGGWPAICQTRDDALEAQRRQFERLYLALDDSEASHARSAPLAGLYAGEPRTVPCGYLPAPASLALVGGAHGR